MKPANERLTHHVVVRLAPGAYDALTKLLKPLARRPGEFCRIVINEYIQICQGRLAPMDSLVYREFLSGFRMPRV